MTTQTDVQASATRHSFFNLSLSQPRMTSKFFSILQLQHPRVKISLLAGWLVVMAGSAALSKLVTLGRFSWVFELFFTMFVSACTRKWVVAAGRLVTKTSAVVEELGWKSVMQLVVQVKHRRRKNWLRRDQKQGGRAQKGRAQDSTKKQESGFTSRVTRGHQKKNFWPGVGFFFKNFGHWTNQPT